MPDSALIRPYIDANVLFSASHKFENEFLRIWAMVGVVPTTSAYVVAEVRRNLRSQVQTRRFDLLLKWSDLVEDPRFVSLPPDTILVAKDRPILSAAIASNCNYLLTGDRHHFRSLYRRTIEGVHILPPSEFCKAFEYRVDLDMLAYNFSEATGW